MRFNLEQWIQNVQAKPEPVRMRYLVGCVAFSMLLVIGIWTLSVSENFQSISSGTKDATENTQGLLPKASDFSLDSLLSNDKSLEDRKKEVSGEAFFQGQLESREQPNFDEEGFVPQGTEEENTNPTR